MFVALRRFIRRVEGPEREEEEKETAPITAALAGVTSHRYSNFRMKASHISNYFLTTFLTTLAFILYHRQKNPESEMVVPRERRAAPRLLLAALRDH